ncbi:hypothetical protein EG68_07259 [Paragonimus skrjabini miyazakii]|uniref:Uncharacterized protein n=1 Tax=Paragonimus skrjabini miyazakii TaxID=59628 RepID=A0A8S9Z0N8_9TREM|nr:hypothetical protein EG68_07259 [Paragonimus skrjabini miyazakii]
MTSRGSPGGAYDPTGSEISNNDSLLQEFQEFEAQVYSRDFPAYQQTNDGTPRTHFSPPQQVRPDASHHAFCDPKLNQFGGVASSQNEIIEDGSLEEKPVCQSTSALFSVCSNLADQPSCVKSDFRNSSIMNAAPFQCANLLPSSHSMNDLNGRHLFRGNARGRSTPVMLNAFSPTHVRKDQPISSTTYLSDRKISDTFEPVYPDSPLSDAGQQLELVNPHPVISHAEEDPIETHDLVIAQMQTSGVVWAPHTDQNRQQLCTSLLAPHIRSDNLRWHSAEIEEDQLRKNEYQPEQKGPVQRKGRSKLPLFHDTPKSVNKPLMESSSISPCVSFDSQANKTDRNIDRSQFASRDLLVTTPVYPTEPTPVGDSLKKSPHIKISEISSGNSGILSCPRKTTVTCSSEIPVITSPSELQARLQQEISMRKQQDDYIRQLQMFYDNLLAKHALAEVTIDQLRMGSKIRTASEDRSPGMHQGAHNRFVSDHSLHHRSQPLSRLSQARLGSFGQLPIASRTPQYSSTPFLRFSDQCKPEDDQVASGFEHRRSSSSSRGNAVNRMDPISVAEHFHTTAETSASHEAQDNLPHNGTSACHTRCVPSVLHNSIVRSRTDSLAAHISTRRPGESPSECGLVNQLSTNEPSRYLHEEPVYHKQSVYGLSEHGTTSWATGDSEFGSVPVYPALDPESVQMDLLFRFAGLRTKLSQLRPNLCTPSDLGSYRSDYAQLKKCFLLAKWHWTPKSSNDVVKFDPDHTLERELFQLGQQLDELEACGQPEQTSTSTAKRPSNNGRLNSFLDNQPSSPSTTHKSDSDTPVSPSVRTSSGRDKYCSSVSSSVYAKENLCALEDLYVQLMNRYNTVKQLKMTTDRVHQLHGLMKRLYDLAVSVNGHSDVIPTVEELENLFVLDNDTRKLTEELDRAIRLERVLPARSNSSSYSNVSSHDQADHRVGQENNSPLLSNPSHTRTESPFVGHFQMKERKIQQMNPTFGFRDHQYACFEASSSTQDSGLFSLKNKQALSSRRRGSSDKYHTAKSERTNPGRTKTDSDSSVTMRSAPTFNTHADASQNSHACDGYSRKSSNHQATNLRTVNPAHTLGATSVDCIGRERSVSRGTANRHTRPEINHMDRRPATSSHELCLTSGDRSHFPKDRSTQTIRSSALGHRESDASSGYVDNNTTTRMYGISRETVPDVSTSSDDGVSVSAMSVSADDNNITERSGSSSIPSCSDIEGKNKETLRTRTFQHPTSTINVRKPRSVDVVWRGYEIGGAADGLPAAQPCARRLRRRMPSSDRLFTRPVAISGRSMPARGNSLPMLFNPGQSYMLASDPPARVYVAIDSECDLPHGLPSDCFYSPTECLLIPNRKRNLRMPHLAHPSGFPSVNQTSTCGTCGGSGKILPRKATSPIISNLGAPLIPHPLRTPGLRGLRVMSSASLIEPEAGDSRLSYPVREYTAWNGHRYFVREYFDGSPKIACLPKQCYALLNKDLLVFAEHFRYGFDFCAPEI